MKERDNFLTFRLSDVNELCLILFVAKPKIEHDLKMRLGTLGARVLMSHPAKGVSRKPILEILGMVSVDMQAIFAIARKEDAEQIIEKIAVEFDFDEPGNGKAFAVDIDGYLGAKGPLVEV